MFRLLSLGLGILCAAAALIACGNHNRAVLPAMESASVRSILAISPSHRRQLIFNVDTSGSSPDGTYPIRSLHIAGTRVHMAFAYKTPNGTFTQIEYATPFGPITLIQAPKRPAPPPPANVSVDDAVTVVQSGTSTHGAQWTVLKAAHSAAYNLHVEFQRSTVDTSVPAGVPLSEIRGAVEELY